jgi:hypothetical protein
MNNKICVVISAGIAAVLLWNVWKVGVVERAVMAKVGC